MRSFRSFVCSQGTRPNEGHGRFPMLEVGLFGGNRVSEINLPALHIDRARSRLAPRIERAIVRLDIGAVQPSIAATDIATVESFQFKIVFARLLIRGNLSGSRV